LLIKELFSFNSYAYRKFKSLWSFKAKIKSSFSFRKVATTVSWT